METHGSRGEEHVDSVKEDMAPSAMDKGRPVAAASSSRLGFYPSRRDVSGHIPYVWCIGPPPLFLPTTTATLFAQLYARVNLSP